MLREYNGLSRGDFGDLFQSKENTVYEWESGRCVPMLVKLMNISAYFGVSIDCIVNGKAVGSSVLETILCGNAEDDNTGLLYPHQFITRFNSLPKNHKERLIGYLEALYRENGT